MANLDLDSALLSLENSMHALDESFGDDEERACYFRIVTDIEHIIEVLTHRKALGAKLHWTPTSAHQMAPLALRKTVSRAFLALNKAKESQVPSVTFATLEDACSLLPMTTPAPSSFEDQALEVAGKALQHTIILTRPSWEWPRPFDYIGDGMDFAWAKEFVLVKELMHLVNKYLNISERCGLTHVHGSKCPDCPFQFSPPPVESAVTRKRLPDWTCTNCNHENSFSEIDCTGCWFGNSRADNKKQKK